MSLSGGQRRTLVRSGEIAPFSTLRVELQSVRAQSRLPSVGRAHKRTCERMPISRAPVEAGGEERDDRRAVPNVLGVGAFGFGAVRDYPTIFVVGWVNRVYGIWRSYDDAQSQMKIGNFPLGSLDNVTTIEGDMNSLHRIYWFWLRLRVESR